MYSMSSTSSLLERVDNRMILAIRRNAVKGGRSPFILTLDGEGADMLGYAGMACPPPLAPLRAGGRYFSIMALCSYGLKCGISEQKIRRDAYAFLDHLESLTEDEDNHFSRADVKDALRALKADKKRLSTIASREWIEKQTKVSIPANKRNGRKQDVHLARARAVQDIDYPNHEWAGRPTAEQTVREWQESHPDGRKIDCERDTGLSKPTVYKWWK